MIVRFDKRYWLFSSVLISKLVYGLETVQVNPPAIAKLDLLQLKGLRKIFKMDTTHGNMQKGLARTGTNNEAFRRARVAVKVEVGVKYAEKVRKRTSLRVSEPPTELER